MSDLVDQSITEIIENLEDPDVKVPLMQMLRELQVQREELCRQHEEIRKQNHELASMHRILEELLHERELAENERNRLQAVLEVLPVAVFISDANGKLLASNPAAVDLWGRTPFSERLGDYKKDYKAWWSATGKRVQSEDWGMTRALTKGERCIAEEMEIEAWDGRRKFILNYALPIIDTEGKINGGVAVNVEITELKQAERALHQLNETLEQRVIERTELAEARTRQLQALAVELIEAEERERRQIAQLLHDDLQQMLASAKLQLQTAFSSISVKNTLLENVEHLLEESIAKSRSLSHELSPAVLHHSGLVAALDWLSDQMRRQFGLMVNLETDAATHVDTGRLNGFLFRAVQELLFNIVKHAEVKSAGVNVAMEGAALAICVSDKGKGFDPETIQHSPEKTGFGILMIKERANYIGGSLKIDSTPGQGSRFTLTVPMTLEKNDHKIKRLPEPQPHRTPRPRKNRGKEGLRVLFADDHKVMRQGLIKLIDGQPDIQVVGEASNGREAIEKTLQTHPDIVVMDISMPEMDGIEATRRIKSELPHVRVIALSMHNDDHLARSLLQAGAESFLIKTATPAELLKAIYGIAGHKEQ